MDKAWTLSMALDIKRRLLVSTVESVLLNGSESWTLTVADEKTLDVHQNDEGGSRCAMGRAYEE